MFRLRRKSQPENSNGSLAIYSTPFWKRPLFATLLFIGVALFIAGVLCTTLFTYPFRKKANGFDLSKINNVSKTNVLYDRNGNEMGQIYTQDRRPAKIEETPWHFIEALVATEDSRFFNHEGFDSAGFGRALLRNFRAKLQGRSSRQGASTITQQLARNAFDLTRQKTISRKITEIFLSKRIERNFTKQEILEYYLNRIYFGSGFYGANTASLGYFGKHISELTLDESAILVGIIKLPHTLSPLRNPSGAIRARNYVLKRMHKEGMLHDNELEVYLDQELELFPSKRKIGYAQEAVRQEVLKIIKDKPGVTMSGLRIETTFDSNLQNFAEKSIQKRLTETEETKDYTKPTHAEHQKLVSLYKKRKKAGTLHPNEPFPAPNYLQGALLAIDNQNGEVISMVGGRDFFDTQFNRTKARRPAGTAFTPFVFSAAFEKELAYPGTILEDNPIDNRRVMVGGFTGILGEWGTESANNSYLKKIKARTALVLGKNAATVRLGEKLGLSGLREFAKKSGITGEIKYPSSYLGNIYTNLFELARAYTIFPNQGIRPKELTFIRRIEDENGNTIYRFKPETEKVTDPVTAYQVHSCLEGVIKEGTASRSRSYGYRKYPAAGKTGTQYGFSDLWFLGYDSNITCGVWVGLDRPKTIYNGAFSNRIALPIWVDYMNQAQKRKPSVAFTQPNKDIEYLHVCSRSGLLATDACYDEEITADGETRYVSTASVEPIHSDYRFNQYCDIHGGSDPSSRALTQLLKDKKKKQTQATTLAGTLAKAEPVHIKSPTLLGMDPYQSIAPVLRAVPLSGQSTKKKSQAPRARPLNTSYGNKKNRVKTLPPTPLPYDP